ncbi:UV radiation resistance-associated protein-like [Lineus longissimus]|uniref:UV radiation resistance-associated protein-like n=1 Tax=Lineus longissimus TaxID=88925 RepID=UPI00315CE740
MASYFQTLREKFAGLPTHQYRLRHLKNIAARNLILPDDLQHSDVSYFQTYFTLHQTAESKAFYTSEIIEGSLNPNWRSFDLVRFQDDINTASSSFTIRVWGGKNHNFRLMCEWVLDLSGLVFLGEQTQKDAIKYKPNSLLFGMFDVYFGAPMEEFQEFPVQDERDAGPRSPDVLLHSRKVEQASVRMSYTTNSLARIITVLRAIKQTQATVRKVRTSIEDRLLLSQSRSRKLAEREMLLLKVNQARQELEWQTNQLQQEKDAYERLQATNHQKNISLRNRHDTLTRDGDRHIDKSKGYFDQRDKYIKTNAQLFMRRKQLISELAIIYPIEENKNQQHTVCGVRLPNSEDFQGEDETMIACSLGYTCHLVQMISQFLDIPLRYPMEFGVSRSRIHDHIIDKLSDSDREFPLYSKGKERFKFNYAVFLLNKNIAQLRNYCGLGTTDLRLTLPNLKSLLELRLGVRFDSPEKLLSGSTKDLYIQHRSEKRPMQGQSANTSPSKTQTQKQSPTKSDSMLQRRNSGFDDILIQEVAKMQPPKSNYNSNSLSSSPKKSYPPSPTQKLDAEFDEIFKGSPDSFFEVKNQVAEIDDSRESSVDRGHDQLYPLREHFLKNRSRDSSLERSECAETMNVDFYNTVSVESDLLKDSDNGDVNRGMTPPDGDSENYDSKFKTWHNTTRINADGAVQIEHGHSLNKNEPLEIQIGETRENDSGNNQEDHFTDRLHALSIGSRFQMPVGNIVSADHSDDDIHVESSAGAGD